MSFIFVKSDGVYSEVSPREVVFKRYPEFHFVRPAFVGIAGLFSVGRYLNDSRRRVFGSACLRGQGFYADGPVVVLIERIREYSLYFLWFCVCRDVPILRLLGKQEIPHASADKVGVKTGAAELSRNCRNLFRNREVHVVVSLSNHGRIVA